MRFSEKNCARAGAARTRAPNQARSWRGMGGGGRAQRVCLECVCALPTKPGVGRFGEHGKLPIKMPPGQGKVCPGRGQSDQSAQPGPGLQLLWGRAGWLDPAGMRQWLGDKRAETGRVPANPGRTQSCHASRPLDSDTRAPTSGPCLSVGKQPKTPRHRHEDTATPRP
jgi:hypothetical protein